MKVIEGEKIEIEEPTVITGFPGPGFVGETTAMLISDALRMRVLGHVESELIPPMLVVMGTEMRPPFRIHGNEDLNVLVVVDNQPIPMEHHRTVIRGLMDWLVQRNVKEIVATDGLPMPDETLEGSVVGFSTDQMKLAELGRLGVLPLTSGAVTGMNAAFLELCQRKGVTFTGLLAPTRRISATNWRGVTSIVDVLNSTVGLNIDVSSILRGVEQVAATAESPVGKKRGIFDIFKRRTE